MTLRLGVKSLLDRPPPLSLRASSGHRSAMTRAMPIRSAAKSV